jgi:hypothetical protein
MRIRVAWLTVALGIGLLFMGALRYSAAHPNALTPIAGFATPGYILVTVLFTVLLMRAGVPFSRLGFGVRFNVRNL